MLYVVEFLVDREASMSTFVHILLIKKQLK